MMDKKHARRSTNERKEMEAVRKSMDKLSGKVHKMLNAIEAQNMESAAAKVTEMEKAKMEAGIPWTSFHSMRE